MSAAEKILPRIDLRLVGEPTDMSLVEANLGLARAVVCKFGRPKGGKIEDSELYSAACFGLMRAAATFDPTKSKFSTWATRIMRNQILSILRKKDSAILLSSLEPEELDVSLVDDCDNSCPLHLASLFIKERRSDSPKEREDKVILSMRYMQEMSLSEIAKKFGLSKERIRQRIQSSIISIRKKNHDLLKEYVV